MQLIIRDLIYRSPLNSFSKWIGVDIWGLIVLIAANRIGNREMINPAIALPLGLMRRPIIENISPNNHKFPIKTGKISVKNRLLSFNEFMMYPSKENNMNDIRTNTSPAVPMRLFCI